MVVPVLAETILASPQQLFYQRLLGAELPSRVAFEIARSADPSEALAQLRTKQGDKLGIQYAEKIDLDSHLEQGCRLLLPEEFPERMRELGDTYPALWSWGSTDCLAKPTIGIVGTRRASGYGKAVAKKFAEALASQGVTIVSGGAAGIDSAAHEGALQGRGNTVAVFGCGVDQVFPAGNAALFERIRRNGLLLSQFAIGTQTMGHRFLARNHLIATLSDALLVIEAPASSGSLTTAGYSAEFGRPVFVVPATIDNLNFMGSHKLIREGAIFVDHPDQILEQLSLELQPGDALPELDEDGTRVYAELAAPLTAEELAAALGESVSAVLGTLTLLEMDGLVSLLDGKWRRTR